MKGQLRLFLAELDRAWTPLRAGRQTLPIIGAGALMLQTDYERGTKDGDVLQTAAVGEPAKAQLLALAGKDSAFHTRHRLYVDVVSSGLPFLPHAPLWHPLTDVNDALTHFHVDVLDVVDVVVSKLKRFHQNDRADIHAMIDRGLVDHARLVLRFESAFDVWKDGAGADDLPRYLRNLNLLERDFLFVPETELEMPSWI